MFVYVCACMFVCTIRARGSQAAFLSTRGDGAEGQISGVFTLVLTRCSEYLLVGAGLLSQSQIRGNAVNTLKEEAQDLLSVVVVPHLLRPRLASSRVKQVLLHQSLQYNSYILFGAARSVSTGPFDFEGINRSPEVRSRFHVVCVLWNCLAIRVILFTVHRLRIRYFSGVFVSILIEPLAWECREVAIVCMKYYCVVCVCGFILFRVDG